MTGKGKATPAAASEPTPAAASTSEPTPAPAEQLPEESSLPKPVATVLPEPISIEEQRNRSNEQLQADLAISSDTSDEEGYADGAYLIDTDAKDEYEDSMSDVEPNDTPEEIVERELRQAELVRINEVAIPLLIQNMGEAVIISDEPREPVPPVSEPDPVAASLCGEPNYLRNV